MMKRTVRFVGWATKQTVRFVANATKRTVCFVVLAGCASSGGTRGPERGEGALQAFQRGDFDQAEALSRDAREDEAIFLRATVLLLKNRTREAADAVTPVATRMAKTVGDVQLITRARELLIQALLRLDDFHGAAQWYARLGDPVLARKYGSLAKSVAYLPTPGWSESTVDLLGTDPLAHVTMIVNGRTGVFLIDTSLDEIVIDRTFAKRAGLVGLGLRTNHYNVSYDESTVEELALGRLTVKNVPVHLGQLTPIARMRADGAIGLAFLMHFDFTIDYRRARLVLRKPGAALPGGLPAVLAGDRYLLVKGTVNGKTEAWLAVNTAMPDVVVTASEGHRHGPVLEIAAGPLRLTQPPLDTGSFPTGLDGGFGFPAPFMLAHGALRDRSIRLEPRSMKLLIE